MRKWTLLEQAAAPGGATMTLHQSGNDYAIRVNGRELMSSLHHQSEDALAYAASDHLKSTRAPKVLIGGLGLGYTLKAALATLPEDATVVVAELLPEVLRWNSNPAYALAADALKDRRTKVEMGDVADVIKRQSAQFHAILLDADNETTAMNTAGNAELYQLSGLAAVHGALKPGGIVVYWSAGDDPRFKKLMGKSGFQVSTQRIRPTGGSGGSSGGQHFLFLGKR
ncbi:spermidine synthase [Planctomyces bekefii]|uniref:Spermidine synthase n=1 Tax=Planctomyces bekefii TaxID=1653850 RepID=A0A5C6M4N2_9PLAN|nr:spermidine synthase [Planctomyces bekefii]